MSSACNERCLHPTYLEVKQKAQEGKMFRYDSVTFIQHFTQKDLNHSNRMGGSTGTQGVCSPDSVSEKRHLALRFGETTLCEAPTCSK